MSRSLKAHGEDRLEAITLHSIPDGKPFGSTLRLAWKYRLCLFSSGLPPTALVQGIVTTNNAGFILTGQDLMKDGKRPTGWKLNRDPYLLETSMPGIFAAGDVRQGAVRRVASAVGEGAIAVSLVHQYLRTV